MTRGADVRLNGDTVRRVPASVPAASEAAEGKRALRKKVRLVVALAALAVALAACSQNAPQDSLKPAGPYADKINDLFTPVFWVAAAIFFLVEGGIVFLLIRYRHRKGREGLPSQVHGNTRLEIAWTIVPALILAGVAVPTVATIFDLSHRPSGDVLNVNVIGHQWWWEFDYPGLKVITANELHIPVGRPVYVTLCSAGAGYQKDVGAPSTCEPGGAGAQPAGIGYAVIHSFWVPELAGKQDVIPGRTNHLVLQADNPGTYSGQCAEFCGLSHANMHFRVIAQAPADFDAWVAAQQQAAAVPSGGLALQGYQLFSDPTKTQCIACHAVQGIQNAQANGAPNLTHFASRDCFAGCIFDNHDPKQVAAWLRNPRAVKPGSFMPNYHLSEDQIRALVAYLESLK